MIRSAAGRPRGSDRDGGAGVSDSEQPWEERAAARVDETLAPAELPRELLLEVFQGELELIGIEALGLAAELGPQELPDHQFQPLALGISLLEGAL